MKGRPALLALLSLAACGYRPLGAVSGGGLHVVLVKSSLAEAVVANEVLAGLRDGLARRGALAGGAGYPRVELEVMGTLRTSEGIALPRNAALPMARGAEYGVRARAELVESEGAPPDRDTGDLTAFEIAATAANPVQDIGATLDAETNAAHALGERLAARILLEPALHDAPTAR